jgi:hypothetical protein
MDDKYRQQQELSEREQQLQERELELRLRELEMDINRQDAPFHPTVREPGGKPARSFRKDLVKAAKFAGLFITGVVIVYISQWLAWISLFAILGIAGWMWVQYGGDRDSSS